jgi:hypothetical protein
METEDNFHPFFRCPLAKQFWNFMAEKWPLPEIKLIHNTGKDWLLTLLENLPKESICKTLMILWRIWHIRNEIVHDKGPPPMEAFRQFLMCYMDSLLQIKYHSSEDIIMGKFVLNTEVVNLHRHDEYVMPTLHWTLPPPGWFKLKTDGSELMRMQAQVCSFVIIREILLLRLAVNCTIAEMSLNLNYVRQRKD